MNARSALRNSKWEIRLHEWSVYALTTDTVSGIGWSVEKAAPFIMILTLVPISYADFSCPNLISIDQYPSYKWPHPSPLFIALETNT